MSRLTVTPDTTPDHPELRTEDPDAIAQALAPIGVRFERWQLDLDVDPDAPSDAILEAYRPHLDRLMQGGAGSCRRAPPAARQRGVSGDAPEIHR